MGYATINGNTHAGIWAGTAASFTDLHALLPSNYDYSDANAIWSDETTIMVAGLAYNHTTGWEEAVLWKYTPRVPKLAVTGKKKIVTALPKIVVKGRAIGTVSSVTYKLGKSTRTANGTTAWKLTALLKPGRNTLTIIAHGPDGDSAPVKVVVTRK